MSLLTPVERLYRRLLMAFGRALIQVVADEAGALQLLQIQLGKDEIQDDTPRFAEYGFTSRPKSGARAIAVFMGGDRSNGAVIATDDPRYRIVLQNGEVSLYDDLGQVVHLTRTGIVLNSPQNVTVEAGGTLRLAGNIVQVHALSEYRWDTNGHGQVWWPTKVDTWQGGETAGTANPITSPEIPE